VLLPSPVSACAHHRSHIDPRRFQIIAAKIMTTAAMSGHRGHLSMFATVTALVAVAAKQPGRR
jgi:hypothetical protein